MTWPSVFGFIHYMFQIARFSTVIVNGIFWAPGMDRLLTTEQCRQLHPKEINIEAMRTQGIPKLPQRLLAIADISCDLKVSYWCHVHVYTMQLTHVVHVRMLLMWTPSNYMYLYRVHWSS